MQRRDVLPELYAAWSKSWDQYVAPARWIKRTLPDNSLRGNVLLFELPFDPKLRATLKTLEPHETDNDLSEGLDALIEQRKQMLKENQCLGGRIAAR